MESINKKNKIIARNTFFLYFRMLFTLAVTLYTSRIVLSVLGVTDYGIYNVVGGVVTTFTFISMAMGNSTARFITYSLGKNSIEYSKIVFSTAVLIHLVLSVGILVLAETLGLWFLNTQMNIPCDRLFASNIVYQISIFATFLGVMNSPLNATIIGHERMDAFAYISILDSFLKLVLIYVLVVFPMDKLVMYSLFLLICQGIVFVINFVYCKTKFPEVNLCFVKDFKLIKSMTGFAGWSLLGNLSYMGYTQGLNILLNIFCGPAVNAARGIAVQVEAASRNFIMSFQTAVNPQITMSYSQNNIDRLVFLVYTASRISYYICFCMVLPLLFEADYVLNLWLMNVPNHSVSFLCIILIILLITSVERPFLMGMNASGNIKKLQIVSSAIMLTILPFSYMVLKIGLAPEFVFIVNFVILLITIFVEILIFHQYYNISLLNYFNNSLFYIVKVSILSVLLPLIYKICCPIEYHSSIFQILFSIFSVIVSIYLVGVSDEERKIINRYIINYKNRKK